MAPSSCFGKHSSRLARRGPADDRFFRHIVSSMRNGVIAIRRDGIFTTKLSGDTVLRSGDEIYICGSIEAFRAISM